MKGLSFLFCLTNPPRLICYGLNKYHDNNTHSPSSGKSLDFLSWFQLCLYSLLLAKGLFLFFVLVFFLTFRSILSIGISSCRSIWTCASHQSSIPPASLTPAAPAPPVTTLCFPMTRYQMSPASPSTSTSMATSKHEPPPTHPPVQPTPQFGTVLFFAPIKTLIARAPPPPPQLTSSPIKSLQMDEWTQLGWCWWQHCCHRLALPCTHAPYSTRSRDILKELTGILRKLFFTDWMNWEPPTLLL